MGALGSLEILFKNRGAKIAEEIAAKSAGRMGAEAAETAARNIGPGPAKFYNKTSTADAVSGITEHADGSQSLHGVNTYGLVPVNKQTATSGTAGTAGKQAGTGVGNWTEMMDQVMGASNWKGSLIGGGAIGLTAAAGGSAMYGLGRVIAPNNSEMGDPVKNMTKGAFMGVAAGALAAASRSASAANLVKSASGSLNSFQKAAQMTKGAMGSTLFKGALGAAVVAGSGDFNFTRPINPVF